MCNIEQPSVNQLQKLNTTPLSWWICNSILQPEAVVVLRNRSRAKSCGTETNQSIPARIRTFEHQEHNRPDIPDWTDTVRAQVQFLPNVERIEGVTR